MRANELNLDDLLEYDPRGGLMTFAGERVVLMDAVALGLLRRHLIELLGETAARGVLTRLGYSHGWRAAESLRDALAWESVEQWRVAGGRVHRLQGLVDFEPTSEGGAFASALWHDSYEAQQHLLHRGLSEEPVCWTLCGYASGYLSYAFGRAICCMEESCVGRGDAVCRMVGRATEDWGERYEEHRPFYELDSLEASLGAVREALRRAEGSLRATRRARRDEEEASDELDGLVARSGSMREAVRLARRVAKVDSTVLITGESGTGKEQIARLIHRRSARSGRPFVAVNCGALTESLLESELFGHKRGAFTGATQDRIGLFEAASGGTLLLDEVGEVSQAMQVKLLRVLQEGTIRRVGENRERPVDVRVLAATHQDLRAGIEAGSIRSDFYYRLRVVELGLAPLRERRDDLLPLARRFLAETAARLGRSEVRGFSRGALERILAHGWPGNVRELRNAVERAVALAEGDCIDVIDLPPEVARGVGEVVAEAPVVAPEASATEPLEAVERRHILRALRAAEGNRTRAAESLGIGVATLFRRLKRYREEGVEVP